MLNLKTQTRSITRTHFILGDVERTTGNTAITSITREILRRRFREKGTYLLSSVFTIHCMLWAVLIFSSGTKYTNTHPFPKRKARGLEERGGIPPGPTTQWGQLHRSSRPTPQAPLG